MLMPERCPSASPRSIGGPAPRSAPARPAVLLAVAHIHVDAIAAIVLGGVERLVGGAEQCPAGLVRVEWPRVRPSARPPRRQDGRTRRSTLSIDRDRAPATRATSRARAHEGA